MLMVSAEELTNNCVTEGSENCEAKMWKMSSSAPRLKTSSVNHEFDLNSFSGIWKDILQLIHGNYYSFKSILKQI